MATLYTEQNKNIRNTWFLMTVFFIMVIFIGWGISWYMNSPGILYGAVLFALLMNFFSYWNSDKVVVRLTGAKEADPGTYSELHRLVENLAITAGLPKPKVYIVHDSSPNAFATGRDPEHALVAVTTGLLEILDRTELEGVIAHELSHVGNRDMLVATVAVTLVGFISIIADMFTRMLFYGGGNSDRRMHPAVYILGLVALILAPIAAKLMQLAVSRKREFLADASGALLTRYPEGLASALQKIQQRAQPMRTTSHATAHLFIANPFGQNTRSLASRLNALFATHPATEDRVAALLGNRP